jgi:hypothetical protein
MPGAMSAGAGTRVQEETPRADLETNKLFDHWVNTVEEEVLTLLKDQGSADIEEIVSKTKLPEEVILVFISRMVNDGKLKIETVAIR